MLKDYARSNRKNLTLAENRLWYYIRNRRLHGYKFIREQVIENYIVDFVCRKRKIIIELDGGQHAESAAIAYDRWRTAVLETKGYQVIRVWNSDVFENITGVLEQIVEKIEGVANWTPSPPPLSLRKQRAGRGEK